MMDLVWTWKLTFIAIALVSLATRPSESADSSLSELPEAAVVESREMVPMRDDIKLSTKIITPRHGLPLPVIVMRTPYTTTWSDDSEDKMLRQFAAAGFVCVAQDCRGTGHSHGIWEPYVNERQDGIDLCKWILNQPWCNGKIATWGGSYVGYTQLAIAPSADGSLRAMLTGVPTFDWHGSCYVGGAYRVQVGRLWDSVMCRPAFGQESVVEYNRQQDIMTLRKGQWTDLFEHLPLRTWDERIGVEVPWARDVLAHPTSDRYWERSSTSRNLDEMAVPNLTVTGWYDLFLNQALEYIPKLRKRAKTEVARQNQYLIIAPYGHYSPGAFDFGQGSQIDLVEFGKQWYGQWLKGANNGVNEWPFLRIFVMGANRWRSENEWPLERTKYTKYYLHSAGLANSLNGDGMLSGESPGTEKADGFVYDPENPVPTHGGEWNGLDLFGPQDQREIESRDDVLVYTSSRLDEPLEVTGPVKVVLYSSTNVPDTDWTAKLVDVHPDGRAFNLCDGILRARYRDSLEKPKLLDPGKIYRYEIDLWATSNEFRTGHRIRVEISSSNFPRFDRNPNTGHKIGVDTEVAVAEQTVYHDKVHPSHIVLPIIPN